MEEGEDHNGVMPLETPLSRTVVVVPEREVLVRGVRKPSEVGREEERGRDVVDGREGVGLDGEGADHSGERNNVSKREGRLLEAEEKRGPGEVEAKGDPVEVEGVDGGVASPEVRGGAKVSV